MFFALILILFVLFSVMFKKKDEVNLKVIDNRDNKILIKKEEKYCSIIKYTASTLPVDMNCYIKKLIVLIMQFLNKNKEIYVSRNEITNLQVIYNNEGYANYLIDIFVWNIPDYHYDFLQFDIVVLGNDLYLNSINYINKKKPEINTTSTTGSKYQLFNPEKNQTRKNFILDNEYIDPSYYRNKWILHKDPCKLSKEGKKQWPCYPASTYWDEFGILKNRNSDGGEGCNGVNTSTQIWPLMPYDNPTITGYIS